MICYFDRKIIFFGFFEVIEVIIGDELILFVGVSIFIICFIFGFFILIVQWKKDDKDLVEFGRILKINNVIKMDMGIFICEVMNRVG